MYVLINYADGAFIESRKQNSNTGLCYGFDSVIEYSRDDIDLDFVLKHKSVFDMERGAGYWLWKPYIIHDCMSRSGDGDIIFYSDAGASFIKNMTPLLDRVLESDTDIFAFRMAGNHKEKEYTKRETLEHFDMYTEDVLNSDQHMASFMCIRNSDKSRAIVKEYMECCENSNLLLDAENIENEHEDFIEHRHDQSIWSLIVKKYGVMTVPPACQWGLRHNQTTQDDFYIEHHRTRI